MIHRRKGASKSREGRREETVVQALPHAASAGAVTGESKSLFKRIILQDLSAVTTSGGLSVCRQLPTPCVLNSYTS